MQCQYPFLTRIWRGSLGLRAYVIFLRSSMTRNIIVVVVVFISSSSSSSIIIAIIAS